jgi:enoyl-CoA hydratase/carnithine racemase
MGEFVHLEVADGVGTIRLDRPPANAIDLQVGTELQEAIREAGERDEVGSIVVWGGPKIFAAGADIKAMAARTFQEALVSPAARFWPRLAGLRTPVIAAVSGYALGGGCELALVCDMIVASESAEFGQPEILLGIIPGGGGTQRLARVMGKQRAMELVLTGRRIPAAEALELGIVNRVAPADGWLEAALELAEVVSRRPPLAVRLGKQAVLAAEETPLSAGLDHERRLYELAMATDDRVEGMNAFLEKRKPEFGGR